jgi:formate dehydrogenase subunit delta
MDAGKLVRMANQIAQFYVRQPDDDAAAEVAAHMKKFWEPRMRRTIYAHLDAGAAGLNPVARKAVACMRRAETGELAWDPAAASRLRDPLEA